MNLCHGSVFRMNVPTRAASNLVTIVLLLPVSVAQDALVDSPFVWLEPLGSPPRDGKISSDTSRVSVP